MTVTLQDRSEELIRPALERAKVFFDKRLKDPAAAAAALARLRMDVAGDGAADADVVIEAIFENVDAKRALYAQLEPKLKPGAILATNTSSIKIETLCEKLADPSRLIGIHFFNPVAQLPLVEIVRGIWTQAQVVQDALKFARKLDKLPLPCKSAPGFVVNRILTPYINEAPVRPRGRHPRRRDRRTAMEFGMPMGPIELTDVVGLDVSLYVGRVLAEALQRRVPDVLARLVDQKKLGRKSGEGFYVWRDGKPQRTESPQFEVPADLTDRLMLPMLNEAVACPARRRGGRRRLAGRGGDIRHRLRSLPGGTAAIRADPGHRQRDRSSGGTRAAVRRTLSAGSRMERSCRKRNFPGPSSFSVTQGRLRGRRVW